MRVTGPSIFGVILLLASVAGGRWFAESSASAPSHLQFTPDHAVDGHLRIHRVSVAGVAAAGSARLSLDLREARNNRTAGARGFHRASHAAISRVHTVCPRRRPHHQRQTFPIPVCHDRLRCDLRASMRWSHPAPLPRCWTRKRMRALSATALWWRNLLLRCLP